MYLLQRVPVGRLFLRDQRQTAGILGGCQQYHRRTHEGLELAGIKNSEPAPGKSPDRKSTRLNSSHVKISYAVFCLKKKKKKTNQSSNTRSPAQTVLRNEH